MVTVLEVVAVSARVEVVFRSLNRIKEAYEHTLTDTHSDMIIVCTCIPTQLTPHSELSLRIPSGSRGFESCLAFVGPVCAFSSASLTPRVRCG